MAITLPFEFDTNQIVRAILRAVIGLLAVVIVPGILYSIFVSHSMAATVQLLLAGGVTTIFARVVLRNLTGSLGIITQDAVVVRPTRLCGFRLPGPVGTFPLKQFKAVRVERIFGPLRTAQGPRWHERVSLIGKEGAPTIVIARTALGAGISMGHDLATMLDLPYLEEVTPY